jgi:hypothetical protein
MKSLVLVLLLATGVALAQDAEAGGAKPKKVKAAKDQITVQGCVGRSSGDYILTKQNPAVTYELLATGKIHLRDYLGQRVEVTGVESPTLSSSSDALNKMGSAAPVTISVKSITTIDKECSVRR